MITVRENINLKPYNTFGLSATARHFVEANSLSELREALVLTREKPFLVLGGGSNMLLTGDYAGLVIKLGLKGIEVISENEDEVVVRVAAGEVWHEWVMNAISQNWGGLENMALIPGCVGAAPIQNIGAYGRELKDVFAFLEAMSVHDGTLRTFTAEACAFGYRDSVFKRELKGKYIITAVGFRLTKNGHRIDTSYGAIQDELNAQGIAAQDASILDVAQAVIRIRQSKLPNPAEIGNAGSFFKNPEIPLSQFEALKAQYPSIPSYVVSAQVMKVPAGWLIEQCGWKGWREGDYGVHAKQALVLVNYGQATGAQIWALSDRIIQDVQSKYGITLEREVNII